MEESSFLHPARALQGLHIKSGMKVADFGAGSGFFTRAAGHMVGPTGVVWAVDMNADLLTRIKNISLAEGLKNIEIVRGDVEQKGGSHLPDAAFDAVIAANLFFSLENKSACVREIARVLVEGGEALIIDWKDSFGGLGPHRDHVVTVGMARDVFEKVGMQYVEDVPAGEYHWGFIVRKK